MFVLINSYCKTLQISLILDSINLKCSRLNNANAVVRGEKELTSNLRNVVERIKSLETQRRNLLLEIEELRKMADSKAKALESEIGMLREEVKSLRILLGAEETEPEFNPKKKK